MKRIGVRLLGLALLGLLCLGRAQGQDARLDSIRTPRGVTQSFIVIRPPDPKAIVILFAGGHGGLGLLSATDMRWGKGNFLVRSRARFAAQGLLVAIVDSPSDKPDGMNAIFRMSEAHARDIEAVADHLRKEADVPVWVVGTSMGTFSAASVALRARRVNGLALTSTVTRSNPKWKIAESHRNGVASLPLGMVKLPTLILSHVRDGCEFTPATDAAKLKARLWKSIKVEVVLLDGGLPPQSDACEARSEHGFLGIEDEAVGEIAKFIRSNAKPELRKP